MEILGSSSMIFNPGANTISLPRSGLTVVALYISNNGIVVPIDSSRNAVIFGGSLSFSLIPLQFKLSANEMNFTGIGGSGYIVVYYGIPDADEPSLDEYSAVYTQVTGIPVGTAGGLQTATSGSINFPSGKYVMKGIQLEGSASGLSVNPQAYLCSFAISPGQVVTYATGDYLQVPYGVGSILPVADLPAPDQLSVSANVYMLAASSTAGTAALYIIIFYALPGQSSKLGSRNRSRSVTGSIVNPFTKQLATA